MIQLIKTQVRFYRTEENEESYKEFTKYLLCYLHGLAAARALTLGTLFCMFLCAVDLAQRLPNCTQVLAHFVPLALFLLDSVWGAIF